MITNIRDTSRTMIVVAKQREYTVPIDIDTVNINNLLISF